MWDEIHQFIKEAKFDLIFDLNVLLRTSANQWNSTNALQLLKYTQRKGYRMAGWELGNGKPVLQNFPYIRVCFFFRGNLIFTFFATIFNSPKTKHIEIMLVIVCHKKIPLYHFKLQKITSAK
jgi:hypothetical protein